MVAALVLSSCINEKPEGADLAVGDVLPDFTVTLSDGSQVTGAMLRETPSCVIFFHTSCPDCQQTLPVIQKLYDEYHPKGVRFAIISREEGQESVAEFWKSKGFTMPYSAQSTRRIYNLFARTRVPRVYISHQGGQIKAIYTDDPLPDYDDLSAEVRCTIHSTP